MKKIELFGRTNEAYSINKINNMLKNNELDKVKDYIKRYLVKINNPPGYLFWNPGEDNVIVFESHLPIPYLSNWFEKETPIYTQVFNVDELRRVYTIDNTRYVNTFPGYIYPKFNDELVITKRVDTIWNHIKSEWCDDDESKFIFIKEWIMKMVMGISVDKWIYLKNGMQDNIITFLCERVLGKKLAVSVPDLTSFSYSKISGKLLLHINNININPITYKMINNLTTDSYFKQIYNNNIAIIMAGKLDINPQSSYIEKIYLIDLTDCQNYPLVNTKTLGEEFYQYCLRWKKQLHHKNKKNLLNETTTI